MSKEEIMVYSEVLYCQEVSNESCKKLHSRHLQIMYIFKPPPMFTYKFKAVFSQRKDIDKQVPQKYRTCEQ
jgi:hypothetical protein